MKISIKWILLKSLPIVVLSILGILVTPLVLKNPNGFLSFSDSAKFADIAKNIFDGLGFGSNFSFWGSSIFELIKSNPFPATWILPFMPYSIAAFFKIFGAINFAVIATSFFYFILTLIFVYLLAKEIFQSKLVGFLSILVVGFSYDLIHYAASGASESPFIFEIVAASYFVSRKRKWASILTVFLLILIYFTRPQAFIYIAGIILYWLLINFKLKKATITFAALLIVGLLVDRLVLWPLTGKFFLYSIIGRGFYSSFNQSSVASDALRGATPAVGEIIQTLKNIFYNLYNFYKLLPQIMSPYLFALFALGLFKWGKDKLQNSFKALSVFVVLATFFITALTIPFFRYIHPIIPFVYIIAVGTLVWMMEQLGKGRRFVILASTFLVLLFGVGQTLGILVLDSRYERNTHNVGKPPVYVQLSYLLRDNTSKDQVIITNLDTWGSWYGERKTVWFPLTPKQLVDPATDKIPFDAIYLTSYLIDDENYYMGPDWRLIFNNPSDPKKWTCEGCGEIADEFTLKGVYQVSSSENYERQEASAIFLIKK